MKLIIKLEKYAVFGINYACDSRSIMQLLITLIQQVLLLAVH